MLKNRLKKLISVVLSLLQMITAFHCSATDLKAICNEAAKTPPSVAIPKTNSDLEKDLPDIPATKDSDSKPDKPATFEQNKTTPKDADTTIIAQGTCGDNVNWILYSDGLLDIQGTGNMEGYYIGTAP